MDDVERITGDISNELRDQMKCYSGPIPSLDDRG